MNKFNQNIFDEIRAENILVKSSGEDTLKYATQEVWHNKQAMQKAS